MSKLGRRVVEAWTAHVCCPGYRGRGHFSRWPEACSSETSVAQYIIYNIKNGAVWKRASSWERSTCPGASSSPPPPPQEKKQWLLPESDTADPLVPKTPRNTRKRRPPSSEPRECTVEHVGGAYRYDTSMHLCPYAPCRRCRGVVRATDHWPQSGYHSIHLYPIPHLGGELTTSLQIRPRAMFFLLFIHNKQRFSVVNFGESNILFIMNQEREIKRQDQCMSVGPMKD